MKKHIDIIIFLLCAFLTAFAAMMLQNAVSNEIMRFILFGIQAAAPSLSAAAVLCLTSDKNAFLRYFPQGGSGKSRFYARVHRLRDYARRKADILPDIRESICIGEHFIKAVCHNSMGADIRGIGLERIS